MPTARPTTNIKTTLITNWSGIVRRSFVYFLQQLLSFFFHFVAAVEVRLEFQSAQHAHTRSLSHLDNQNDAQNYRKQFDLRLILLNCFLIFAKFPSASDTHSVCNLSEAQIVRRVCVLLMWKIRISAIFIITVFISRNCVFFLLLFWCGFFSPHQINLLNQNTTWNF